MEVFLDEVVDVIAVWNSGVAARWPVHVIRSVAVTAMPRRACRRMFRIDRDRALVDMVAVHGVKVTVMHVVDVTVVLDRDVAAVGAVNVVVLGMCMMGGHPESFPSHRRTARTMPCSLTATVKLRLTCRGLVIRKRR